MTNVAPELMTMSEKERLLAQWTPWMCKHLHMFDPDALDDAIQEVKYRMCRKKIWAKCGNFTGVLMRCCIEVRREITCHRRKHKPPTFLPLECGKGDWGEALEVTEFVFLNGPDAADDLILAKQAVKALPEREGRILALFCEGNTQAEIAEIEGISPSRVFQLVQRAQEIAREAVGMAA